MNDLKISIISTEWRPNEPNPDRVVLSGDEFNRVHLLLTEQADKLTRLRSLAEAAKAAELEYLDLEAIERHGVLPFDQQAAHSKVVNEVYSRWIDLLAKVSDAVLAGES